MLHNLIIIINNDLNLYKLYKSNQVILPLNINDIHNVSNKTCIFGLY